MNIDAPMPIITPRLILMPIKEADAYNFHEAKLESYDDLSKWRIWVADCPRDKLSVEQDKAFCKAEHDLFQSYKQMMLMAFERNTNKFIGDTGINNPNWELRSFSTGYWVRSSETGKGYATEMALAIAHYVFSALDATKLSISHADGNDASARIINKVGYKKEKIFKNGYQLAHGKVADKHCYKLQNLDDVPALNVIWGRNEKRVRL